MGHFWPHAVVCGMVVYAEKHLDGRLLRDDDEQLSDVGIEERQRLINFFAGSPQQTITHSEIPLLRVFSPQMGLPEELRSRCLAAAAVINEFGSLWEIMLLLLPSYSQMGTAKRVTENS